MKFHRCFGKMLLLLTIIVFLLVLTAAAVYIRRQNNSGLLEDHPQKNLEAENLRPLFAPDEEELAREGRELAEAEQIEKERLEVEKKLASFDEFRQTWRTLPDRENTIEILYRASQIQRADIYLETVAEVLANKPANLSKNDLAQLIESHFWLLPAIERTPGAAFTINQEVSALRENSKKGQ